MILPYIENDKGDAEQLLAPFQTTIQPVFQQVGVAPTLNAVSHGSDSFLSNAPPRSVTGGAMISEIWEDLIGRVFGDWIQFTENEEHKGSVVMWEFYAREKVAETAVNATAYPVRAPHYYVALTARYVKRKCREQ